VLSEDWGWNRWRKGSAGKTKGPTLPESGLVLRGLLDIQPCIEDPPRLQMVYLFCGACKVTEGMNAI
jgi:hypothetical protein